MKPIGIVTDSHCGISTEEASKYGIRVLPMPLYWFILQAEKKGLI